MFAAMTNSLKRPLAITSGEPAGIGPDVCCHLALQPSIPAVVYGCPDLMTARAKQMGLSIKVVPVSRIEGAQCGDGILSVKPIPGCANKTPGELTPENAPYVLKLLDAAIDDCLSQKASALVTAPVHKGNLSSANAPFYGHTEYLAQRTNTDSVSMMFASTTLLVGLVTVHQPLATVAGSITKEAVMIKLQHLVAAKKRYFPHCPDHVGVLGLNPHAGENGLLGKEEQEIIRPTIDAFHQRTPNLHIEGPLSPDSAFLPSTLSHFTALLGMYHDQVLIALKGLFPRSLVNLTWGLPFLRVSVDHGTAIHLAGSNQADPSSLLYAVQFALEHTHDDA